MRKIPLRCVEWIFSARLDGTSKPMRHTTIEDYLQMDGWDPPPASSNGKKRVSGDRECGWACKWRDFLWFLGTLGRHRGEAWTGSTTCHWLCGWPNQLGEFNGTIELHRQQCPHQNQIHTSSQQQTVDSLQQSRDKSTWGWTLLTTLTEFRLYAVVVSFFSFTFFCKSFSNYFIRVLRLKALTIERT